MNNGQTPTAVRRQKEQAQRRKSILKAAREVFFQRGFMAATIEEIAGRCGLAKGTIYLYFKCKEELYVSIMGEGMGLLKKEFAKIAGLPLQSDELLLHVLQTYFAFYRKNRKYFRIMFLSSQPDVRELAPDKLLRECMDTGRDCMRTVSDIVQKGIESGIFRTVNPWAVANILWSTINGIIMSCEQDSIYREEILGMEIEQILLESLDLALNGLRRAT
ncbi:MAG: TetR/AcrR family transcriptional regulator [Syntrophobacteraceae bacterium]|jgi:AcrR family transcriptional regulator